MARPISFLMTRWSADADGEAAAFVPHCTRMRNAADALTATCLGADEHCVIYDVGDGA